MTKPTDTAGRVGFDASAGAGCLCGGLRVDRAVLRLSEAALEAEITALSRVDSAVVARRSVIVSELSRRRSDAADRVRQAGNMSAREAKKAAKTADGLAKLGKTREALERGEIGKEQAEQLASRMDKPELAKNVVDNEEALLERAKNESVDEFARTMRKDDLDSSPDGGNTQARRQRQARTGSMWIDPDTGMHHLFAKFDPVTGARVSASLAAMVDKIWRAEHAPGVRNKRRLDHRRADALEALICRGMTRTAAEGGPTDDPATDDPATDDTATDDTATGSTTPCEGAPDNQQGFDFGGSTGGSRCDTPASPQPSGPVERADQGLAPVPPPPSNTQLLVIANLDALRQVLSGGSLADGTPLPAETVATMACDADILPAIFDTAGQPLWLGRTQRLATSAQRAAVTVRDHGCIVCGASAEFCQVHHIIWWSNGGTTDLDNLCLLCSGHHTMVHERGLTITTTPDGFKVQPRPVRPPARRSTGPPGALDTAA